ALCSSGVQAFTPRTLGTPLRQGQGIFSGMRTVRTQVGIVGAGQAGLLLGRLLAREGVDTLIVEDRTREYIEARQRAGVIEHPTAQLLRDIGVGERLDREG